MNELVKVSGLRVTACNDLDEEVTIVRQASSTSDPAASIKAFIAEHAGL